MAAAVSRYFLFTLALAVAIAMGGPVAAHPGHAPAAADSHAGHNHAPAQSSGAEVSEAGPPRSLTGLLLGYGLVISLASLAGGAIPGRWRFSHLQFQMLISLVGGLMLGVAVLHLLVHAVHEAGASAINELGWSLLLGILGMFLLLRVFHVHCHATDEPGTDGHGHSHGEACHHDHDDAGPGLPDANRWSWIGLFVGLGLHTVMDGIALAIAMQAEASHDSRLPGLGTLLAVALHKPVDSMSITTLMLAGGWSPKSRRIANLAFAVLAPLAAAAVLLGFSSVRALPGLWLGCGLSASAGVFLCIALADLLPEMQFHSHHRWRLTTALLLGVALAWSIQFLEPAHLH